ncbi:MAG: type II toxin-antitoxin system HicB family antitoxin [Candidatus Poribacteria bacterium]|nr:type II toxin-antitoxin system HicB family antitoxin [Candidatus Poribacteria bacterium]MDE0503938.1 type II toxin-antitoxin system HicB family antitoxin [Candidatus Poribacteria bacterium]
MKMEKGFTFRITLILKHQPDGVFTVYCKELPELITDGDSVEEALENAKDAFIANLELYFDDDRRLPREIFVKDTEDSIPKISTLTPTEGVSDWCFQATLPPPPELGAYAT